LALTALPAGAFAQVTFFGSDSPRGSMTNSTTARNAFHAALNSFGVDNIESHPSFSTSPTLVFGATGITATTPAAMLVADFTGQSFNYAASGVKALLEVEGLSDQFVLSAPVNGFGFFVAQSGDLTNVNTISLLLENTITLDSEVIPIGTFGPGRSDDNIFYFGVITNDQFNRITVVESFDGDGTLYDDVAVGFAAVPEPGSIALIALASAATGLVWYRRRRRQTIR
jgi:hypothetical protein